MTRQEAVQKLAKIARISVSYAEDLYDSFFPKPVVPQYVADWYEEHKEGYDYELWDYFSSFDYQKDDDFKEWTREDKNQPIITLVNMHRFGYEVGEEPRYTVRFKGLYGGDAYLTDRHSGDYWDIRSYRDEFKNTFQHTRKNLESNGFGWVFNCPGVEVKEVE